ncbi:peptide-modifying radical SAM enzyme CbpB [Candidatus Pyrohabitans sp.]
MFQSLTIDGTEFKLDPETNFWGVGEQKKLEELYSRVRDELIGEMRSLRFSREIILLYVNPTDRCNASCPYCYLPRHIKLRGRSMDYAELCAVVEKAIEFFEDRGLKGTMVFHGSEPLMNRENIFRVIEEYQGRLNFGIQTNGLLLTEEDAEFIRERKVNIGISLDSPLEETNDLLRGRGHYRKVLEVLEWLSGYRGLNVVTTITKHNQRQLADMVKFLHGRKVSLCLMNPVRGTQKDSLTLRPEPHSLAEDFIKAVDTAIELTKQGQRIVVGDFANLLLGIIAPGARVLMCDISPCGAGRRFFSVAADGTCYPCGEFIGMQEFAGGGIFDNTIEDISSSEGFKQVAKRAVEEIEECNLCLFRNICGAPCPAEVYSTQGSMYSKSYYCDFYRPVIEHAFRVILRGDTWHVLRRTALREKFSI